MKKIILNGEIPVNCYIIENQNFCYVVDPGYEKERLIKYIEKQKLTVVGILLTHCHIDHIGALDAFNVPVYIHEEEIEILHNNYKNGFKYYKREIPYKMDSLDIRIIKNKSKLNIGNSFIEVIHTPGHTKGGVCFKHNNELYTGDTLFRNSVGRWDFPTGNQEILRKSVLYIIDELDESIKVFPAHGDCSTIEEEKQSNEYYIYWKKKGLMKSSSKVDKLFEEAKNLLDNSRYVEAHNAFKLLVSLKNSNPLSLMYMKYTEELIKR